MIDRAALLAELADEVLAQNASGRRMLAIDGVDGAGKTTFADALAPVLRERGVHVVRASVDGFHRRRAERYARGRGSAEGYYRDSFDLESLRSRLFEPFRAGADEVVVAAFDHVSDAPIEVRESGIPNDAVLVIDGADSLAPRYSEGQSIYAREASPRRAAAIIVDNNDAAHPRRDFADYC